MSENEKKHESQNCCCCQSWKAIFIAIAFMVIGAVFGHMITKIHMMMYHSGYMMGGPYGGGYGREAFWDRGGRERECSFERKFQGRGECDEKGWFGHKGEMGKCKPGCTCPMCSKMAASLSEPNKANCPMMDKGKKEGKVKK
jgi:hypothetical protein